MSEIKAGVVVVTKFCQSSSSKFTSYINYIDRDEAVRADCAGMYNLYQDYMGNTEKTSGLFTEEKEIQSEQEKQQLKAIFQTAQKNGSLMWQTVISFDNRWLEKNGLYDSRADILDEARLRGITRSAVSKMLEKEGLENAVWSAAVHYNTDNIHIHIATVEPEPMREQKEYIQYEYKMENGRYVKTPQLDNQGNPITKKEYKGRFKQSSLETCKREMVNQIINERENNLKINSIIRDSIVKQKKEHPLIKDQKLVHAFLNLYKNMPDCSRNMWNYNNPIMHSLHSEIDHISDTYLIAYHREELEELKARLQIQNQKYEEAYGKTDRNYVDTKMQDLYSRLGNAVLKEIREYDKEHRQDSYRPLSMDSMDLPDRERDFEQEKDQEVINDPLILGSEIEEGNEVSFLEDFNDQIDETFFDTKDIKLVWSQKFKKAKKLIHARPADYETAISLLTKEYGEGNVLAAYELGDIYRYGRGREIDVDTAEKYYKEALRGFAILYNKIDKKEYLAYRMGKMHYYGLGTEENFDKARNLFEASGNVYSQYMLGKMAYAGQGMEQNYQKAFDYFDEIAEDNAYAAYQAAIMIENKNVAGSEEQMQNYYEMAFSEFCEMEEKDADDNLEYRIGCMYINGKGTEKDEEQAEEFLTKASEAGNLYAKNKLAMLYLKQGRQDKFPEIVETLKEVAEKTENIWSMYALGNIYSSGQYAAVDMEQAIYWYKRAEKEGNSYISYRLGKLYSDPEKSCYDLGRAVEHMEKAMNCGNVLAAYQLGKIYLNHDSEFFDLDKAIHYFKLAADQSNALAAYQLGKIYMSESYELQNIPKAIQYLEQAAKEDPEYATYQLGKIYFDEKYGVKDDDKAYSWFSKSAEQGNTHALYRMGRIDYARGNYQRALENFEACTDMYSHYYMGKIFLDNEKENPYFDVKKGIDYMKLSAQEGNSAAEASLGVLFLKGEVVTRDIGKAKEWFTKAAEHGNEFAGKMVEDMKNGQWYFPRHHIFMGVSITTALSKMKQGLKSEWEKSRLQREHDRMVEQSIDE